MEKIVVTDEFIDIYRNFNIYSQVDRANKLSRKDRLLLWILTLDSFTDDSGIVIDNYRPFKEELQLIMKLQADEEITDTDLIELGTATGEKYVDVEQLVDSEGNKLPKPYTEEEAVIRRRDHHIDDVLGN